MNSKANILELFLLTLWVVMSTTQLNKKIILLYRFVELGILGLGLVLKRKKSIAPYKVILLSV